MKATEHKRESAAALATEARGTLCAIASYMLHEYIFEFEIANPV